MRHSCLASKRQQPIATQAAPGQAEEDNAVCSGVFRIFWRPVWDIHIYMDILGYIGMYMMYWDITRYCDGCECLGHLVMDFDSF